MTAPGWLQLSLAAAATDSWPELTGGGPSLRAAWVWAALAAAFALAALALLLGRRLGLRWPAAAGEAEAAGHIRVLARRRLAPACDLALVEVGAAGIGTQLLLSLSPRGPEVLRELPRRPAAEGRRSLEALP